MSMWFLTNASAQAIYAQVVKLYSPENEVIGGSIAVYICIKNRKHYAWNK